MEAASEFAKKLKKRSVAALTKLDMMSELGTLKSGLSGYEALGVRCMQLAKLPAGRGDAALVTIAYAQHRGGEISGRWRIRDGRRRRIRSVRGSARCVA